MSLPELVKEGFPKAMLREIAKSEDFPEVGFRTEKKRFSDLFLHWKIRKVFRKENNMAIPVLIIGKSGSGKSTSMRNCVDDPNWNLISVLGKPLPFRGKIPQVVSDDYRTIMASLSKSTARSIVIDDAGYLITNMFMKEHSSTGGGNAVFAFYNKIADHFWNLIEFIRRLPDDWIIYVMMHEEQSDFGDIKPKTLGKLLDEKVCVEGMFTIVLRSIEENGKYYFITQMKDGAVSKSPVGMFEDVKIDNDLKMVDDIIRKYYEIEVTE